MKPSRTIDLEIARKTVEYDPETGNFKRLDGRLKCETTASKYKTIMVRSVRVASHRLAWAMYYGNWPNEFIDHIDGDRQNNKIENLRECTSSENYQNRKLCKFNKYGMTGVSFSKAARKYVAQIQVDKKKIHIGVYETPEEAGEAYKAAKAVYHKFQPTLRES